MDAYLAIAQRVLRHLRQPADARKILVEGIRLGVVPVNLHGRTQHKTIQARLSEDIVAAGERSAFFRTSPGRFFLREFLDDATLPEHHRQEFISRRRFRDIDKTPVLALNRLALTRCAELGKQIKPEQVCKLFSACEYDYVDPRKIHDNFVIVRPFVSVRRRSQVLTYRLGRYREDRDAFLYKKSAGFFSFVRASHHSLFDQSGFGILESGTSSVMYDLGIPVIFDKAQQGRLDSRLKSFIWTHDASGASTLLAAIDFQCPGWFEPTKRRIAISDLKWEDMKTINNIGDFDPWSQCIFATELERQKPHAVVRQSWPPADRTGSNVLFHNSIREWERGRS